MNEYSSANTANFNKVFDNLPEADYQVSWANGTGYFDGACKDESITAAVRSIDGIGRKLIILPIHKRGGDRFKNLVYFERYIDDKNQLIVHCPRFQYGRTCGRLMMCDTSMPLSRDAAYTWAEVLANMAAAY